MLCWQTFSYCYGRYNIAPDLEQVYADRPTALRSDLHSLCKFNTINMI